MSTKEKSNLFTVYINLIRLLFGISVFIVFVFLGIGEVIFPDERDIIEAECQIFEANWQQILENGDRVSVEVPGKIEAAYGEVVRLTTTLPDEISNKESLCFRTIWQDVVIYVDGEIRESYNTINSRPFGTNSAFRYVFVDLNEGDAGKELIYEFSSNSKYAGVMRTSYVGDRLSIWLYLINESGMRTIISFFLLILSFFCVVVCFILKFVYKINLPLKNLAWAILLCALWMLSEVEFRQILFRNVSIITNATYWSLMLIPFPIIIYIDEIQGGRYRKVYVGPIVYSLIIFIVGTILQVFDVVQFVEQLPFIHFGTAVSIICLILTIIFDVFKKRISDYLVVGIGIFGMLFTAVIEILLYYMDLGISLGTVLAVGLLFLLIMAIIKTGQDLFRSEQKKQQAILAREAQAKFLANMSHEIRTPINAVIGMNEMILRENEDESVAEYARNIQSASNMLLSLVNDILDFSKIESGQLELFEDTYSLSQVIQDEILLLNARVTKKPISTQIDVAPNIPSKFFGDELRIKQVLTNLLSNAVKYTKEGSVTLKVFCQWIDADTVKLCFSVIDTGVGIKKEDLSQLFDSFKRLEINNNRNIEGTGLGLNIAKQLVDLMKGSISVNSEYGKGSTFTVSIPQKVVDRQPIGSLETLLHESRKEKTTQTDFFTAPEAAILVVDDNSMNLSLMKGLLKRTKCKVDIATSGKECLELTKQKTYDIILMDHMMPELDGIQTLHMLRMDKTNPNCNTIVIALTANAVAGCREMYLQYGFDDYLSKPIQVEQLDAMLMQHLSEKFVKDAEKEAKTKEEQVLKENISEQQASSTDMLYIDCDMGLSYCLDSEEFYKEVLSVFCEQGTDYLAQLDTCFQKEDWKQYAIIAHSLKGNAINIGATVFSELCLKHELAAKEANAAFIEAEYETYIATYKDLMKKIEKML